MGQTKELCEIPAGIEKKDRGAKVGTYSILVRMVGVFLARAMPFSGFAPFGISFLAMERRLSMSSFISFCMVCVGYVSLFDAVVSIQYICVAAAYMLFLFIADRGEIEIPPIAGICAASAVTALSRLCVIIWTGFTVGEAGRLLCDTLLVALSAFVFEKNRCILNGRKSSLFSMNSEEKLCFAILVAIVIMGFKSIRITGFLYTANVIGIWITAVIAICAGSGYGAVCGVIVGSLLGFDVDIAAGVAAYALCGMVCGAVSKYGRIVAVAAVCGIFLSAAIYQGFGSGFAGYLDTPLAAVALMVTSDSAVRTIGRITGLRKDTSDSERWREYTKERLNTAAYSFRTLAQTFFELSDKNTNVDMEDISMMFDRTVDRVCRECSRVSECWVNNFNSTYKSMFHMLEVMERKGELAESDADEFFARKCLRLRGIVREMNRLFEIYKINCVWKSKLNENRELTGEQLASVAQILDNISDELYEERLDAGAEEEICMRLASKGIDVLSFSAALGAKGRYVAYMEVDADENIESCRRAAETALKAVLGAKMAMVGIVRNDNGDANLKFTQPEGYLVETGVSSKALSDENGDNCVMRYLSGGKYAAALSDGMGTGRRASRDSGATVKLLGDFLEAGFDKTVAVRLVNSIMVMKSANEAFSTVDMCVIDLFSGEAEFIKNGAEPSYIKHKESVETVRSASLPVGVMQNVTIESFVHKLEAEDVIVMLSDGLQMKKGHEDWIRRVVEEAEDRMPAQELADRIMDMAKTLQGEDNDDRTVIVMKIHERN